MLCQQGHLLFRNAFFFFLPPPARTSQERQVDNRGGLRICFSPLKSAHDFSQFLQPSENNQWQSGERTICEYSTKIFIF